MNETETIADIVREMREMKCHTYADVAMHADFCGYADRIEAAAKRELSRAAEDAASKATLDRTAKDTAEYMAYAMAHTAPQPGSDAAMRAALVRILEIEGYGAPWIEAKCIAQKALEGKQCTPPIAQESPKIEQPGSAAAMREAMDILEKLDYAIPYVYQNRSPQNEIARLVRIAGNKVREALAAPARNCDRFKNVGDALKAHCAYCERRQTPQPHCLGGRDMMCSACLDCFADWLFDPIKENGGNKQ